MKISSKSLIGSPVYLSDKKSALVLIRGVLVSGETGLVLGFKVGLNNVISFQDINWDGSNKRFYVKEADSICDASEIVRINNLLDSENYFNKQRVVTEGGKILGRLWDLEFEPITGSLVEIIARKRFLFGSKDTMVIKSRIVDVDSKKIVVKGNGATVKESAINLKNKTAPVTSAALSDLLTN